MEKIIDSVTYINYCTINTNKKNRQPTLTDSTSSSSTIMSSSSSSLSISNLKKRSKIAPAVATAQKRKAATATTNGFGVYIAKEWDVICKREHGRHEQHPGNIFYRDLINLNKKT
jgi:hypothetical protein